MTPKNQQEPVRELSHTLNQLVVELAGYIKLQAEITTYLDEHPIVRQYLEQSKNGDWKELAAALGIPFNPSERFPQTLR